MLPALFLFSLLARSGRGVEVVPLDDVASAYSYILNADSFCQHRRVALFSDKPVYKNGETAHFTAYFYQLITKEPLGRCQTNQNAYITVYDSKDNFIASLSPNQASFSNGDFSAIDFDWTIDKALPGGAYKVKYDDGSFKDEISVLVLKFNNRAFALVGDWNSDTVTEGFVLKGKITVKALTTELSQIENGVFKYSFLDSNANELVSNQQPLGSGEFQINFQVPALSDGLLVFQADLNSDTYQATYKREFYKPNNDNVVIDFTLARGKIVLGQSNKFYFQAFADKNRIDSVSFTGASLLLVSGATEQAAGQVNSDDDGRGSFDFTPTAQHIADGASLVLRVSFGSTGSRDFAAINFAKAETSPVALILAKLVVKATDSFDVQLKSDQSINRVHLLLQDKTRIIYKTTTAISPGTKTVTINLWQLSGLKGGVYTLQLYGDEPPVVEPVPLPEPQPQPKPQPELQPVALADAVAVAKGEDPLIKAVPIDIILPRPIPQPVPVINPLVDYKGQILQEADIFIKPERIIGAQVRLDKTFYLPGDKIAGTVRLNKTCSGCDRDPVSSGLRAYVVVTDESAFLEIDKARENPSLFTKVFLQKEVFSPTSQFKASYRFIDYLFDSSGNLFAADLQAADKRLELLIGNQGRRKFLFDPDHLQDFVNNPWDSKYDEVRDLFNYLVPKVQSRSIPIYQPIFVDNVVVKREDVPANGGVPVPLPPSPSTPDNSSDALTDQVFKKDTILYQKLFAVTGDEIAFSATLPDYATNFSVRVFLFNGAANYGFAQASVKVRRPLNISFDAPLYIYTDESFVLPIIVENNQSSSITVQFTSPVVALLTVGAQRSATRNVTLQPNQLPLQVIISDLAGTQLLRETISPAVIKAGIRGVSGTSGFVSTKTGANSALTFKENLPVQLIKGGNSLTVCYQNDAISLILEIIKVYNRIPAGCFEQASMTTFPLIIAIRILKLLPQTPEIAKLLAELIANLRKGIALLLTYECSDGGFEWFGVSPGQTALTAYGLEQFLKIKELNESALAFDEGVIARSREFLRTHKNGQGGYLLRQGYDEFGNPPQDVSDIFITLVLSGLVEEFDALFSAEYDYVKATYAKFKAGQITLDSYKLALIGLLFANKGELVLAAEITAVLITRQDGTTGEVLLAETSVTRSSGTSLALETTALAMLLVFKLNDTTHNDFLDKALRFLLANMKGGYFQSTQATVLALRAIAGYLASHQQAAAGAVTFDVILNSQPTQQLAINANDPFSSKCLDLSALLKNVENSGVEVRVTVQPNAASLSANGASYLFAITLETYSYLPNSTSGSPLNARLQVAKSANIRVYSVSLQNNEAKEQGMAVWAFNKPSCLDFSIGDLESLRERHVIDFYEIRNANSQVVFYWRGLAANASKAFSLSLAKRYKANECVERTSEAYLYYGKEKSLLYRRP